MIDWAEHVAKAMLALLTAGVLALLGLVWRDSRQIAMNSKRGDDNYKGIQALSQALDKEIEARRDSDRQNTKDHEHLRESISAIAQLAAIQDVQRQGSDRDVGSQSEKISGLDGRMDAVEKSIVKLETTMEERFKQLFVSVKQFDRRNGERGA